ncbi:MAG TPA: hypothetical protein VIK33_07705 [Anaerolineae bacterium]
METSETSFDPQAGDLRGGTVNLRNGGVRDVYADTVTISRGGARTVSADSVTVKLAGVQEVEAQSVVVKQGGAARVTAEQAEIAVAAIGLVQGETVRVGPSCQMIGVVANKAAIEESMSAVVVARDHAHLDQSGVAVLVSNRVEMNDSVVLIAVADTVQGGAQVQVKPPVAAIFGAAFGAALGAVLLLGRRGK